MSYYHSAHTAMCRNTPDYLKWIKMFAILPKKVANTDVILSNYGKGGTPESEFYKTIWWKPYWRKCWAVFMNGSKNYLYIDFDPSTDEGREKLAKFPGGAWTMEN